MKRPYTGNTRKSSNKLKPDTQTLGLDLGRTWLRACLADGEGRVLRRARMPAVAWRRLPEALRRLRRRLGFRGLERLTVGAAGLWARADRAAARRLLRGWGRQVRILSDAELAHRAAFAGGPGILIAGGTGSIALARDRRGRVRRAGGWGPLLGDEGSGFWIGRAALRDAVLRRKLRLDPLALARSPQPVRAVAGLAPRILRLARIDGRARRLRNAAVKHLVDLAAEVGQGLWDKAPAVSWRGGLFQDRAFRARFFLVLRRTRPSALARPPLLPAEVAAAVVQNI